MALSLGELGDRMKERAAGLLQGRPVTRRDVAYLLIAAGHVVWPRAGVPELPAERVAEGRSTPLEAFWPVFEAERRALRWMVALQAMDAAGWPPTEGRERLATQAVTSDEALREVLAEIGLGRVGRGRRPGPKGAG
jgi:hypothetical protein